MQEFLAEIPRNADSMYYNDAIGNISTSIVSPTSKSVSLSPFPCLSYMTSGLSVDGGAQTAVSVVRRLENKIQIR